MGRISSLVGKLREDLGFFFTLKPTGWRQDANINVLLLFLQQPEEPSCDTSAMLHSQC